MIRFDFRQKWTSLGLAALVASGMMISVPQAGFASDWVDILKPLVTNVIVPGASMGMKKLIQREERLHPELAKKMDGTSSSTSGTATSAIDSFFDNSASTVSSTTDATTESFATPEEPISSSNTGSSTGADFWAASTSASATEPALAPPPPVVTP